MTRPSEGEHALEHPKAACARTGRAVHSAHCHHLSRSAARESSFKGFRKSMSGVPPVPLPPANPSLDLSSPVSRNIKRRSSARGKASMSHQNCQRCKCIAQEFYVTIEHILSVSFLRHPCGEQKLKIEIPTGNRKLRGLTSLQALQAR